MIDELYFSVNIRLQTHMLYNDLFLWSVSSTRKKKKNTLLLRCHMFYVINIKIIVKIIIFVSGSSIINLMNEKQKYNRNKKEKKSKGKCVVYNNLYGAQEMIYILIYMFVAECYFLLSVFFSFITSFSYNSCHFRWQKIKKMSWSKIIMWEAKKGKFFFIKLFIHIIFSNIMLGKRRLI